MGLAPPESCPRCGAPAQPGHRFCNACGAPLAARAAEPGRAGAPDDTSARKVVTIVFADLIDGVMCAFGVPHVAEDDAIRAVRAAVAVQ